MSVESKDLISIRVLIVDDHTLFAEGTASLLATDPRILVVGIAKTGAECLDLVNETSPDIVLLDVYLPDSIGTELIEKIKEIRAKTKIIMLTGQNPQGFINESIRRGATGFILKDCSVKDMVEGILKVYHGKIFFLPTIGIITENENGPTSRVPQRALKR